MSSGIYSKQYTVSPPRGLSNAEQRVLDAQASDPHRRRPLRINPESQVLSSTQFRENVSRLWANFEGTAYGEVKQDILAQWTGSLPWKKKFLEKAVDLLAEFQNRSMENMKDSLEWSKYLEAAEIDTKAYLDWAQNQYKLLAFKQRQFFEVSLEELNECLSKANWKDANDDSAIVNAYLLNADLNLKPDIYLGPTEKSHLAVRLNGRCLRPPNSDLLTAERYGVTVINLNILLSVRYVSSESKTRKTELLFIPIGNVFRRGRSRDNFDTIDFRSEDWKDTGVVLVLSILKTGDPGWLYMIRDPEFWEPAAGEGEKPMIGLGSNSDKFTFAEVKSDGKNMPYRALRSCEDTSTTEKSVLSLDVISDSGLEIAQTGVKEDWSEDSPPVGLYPNN